MYHSIISHSMVPHIHLYAPKPLSFEVVCALNNAAKAVQCTLVVLPISQLPAPAPLPQRRQQQMQAELAGLKTNLSKCLDFIVLAENNPTYYDQLPALRRERDAHEFRIVALETALKQQEGGQNG